MGSLRCSCGFTMRNNACENEVEGILIADHFDKVQEFCEAEVEGEYDKADAVRRSVWQCEQCGGLAIAKELDGHQFVYYKPETEKDRVKMFSLL